MSLPHRLCLLPALNLSAQWFTTLFGVNEPSRSFSAGALTHPVDYFWKPSTSATFTVSQPPVMTRPSSSPCYVFRASGPDLQVSCSSKSPCPETNQIPLFEMRWQRYGYTITQGALAGALPPVSMTTGLTDVEGQRAAERWSASSLSPNCWNLWIKLGERW